MKYVITGAGGFIGKALTQRLLAETEAELTLFDQHFGRDALYRNDRGLTADDATALDVDERRGRAKVDGEVVGEESV